MKNLLWFLFGAAAGFVVAHFVNKHPRGHELLAQVDDRISEFTDRIAEAYNEQDARITGLVASATGAAADAFDAAKDAAADAVDTAGAAVADAVENARDAARKLAD